MAADPRTLLYKNADPTGEAARAQRLAEQYGFEFVDLSTSRSITSSSATFRSS